MMFIASSFIVGAAVGTVSTYVYKDESTREWLSGAAGKVKDKSIAFSGGIKDKSSSILASFKKKDDGADAQKAEAADKAADEQNGSKEAAADVVEKEATDAQKDVKAAEKAATAEVVENKEEAADKPKDAKVAAQA